MKKLFLIIILVLFPSLTSVLWSQDNLIKYSVNSGGSNINFENMLHSFSIGQVFAEQKSIGGQKFFIGFWSEPMSIVDVKDEPNSYESQTILNLFPNPNNGLINISINSANNSNIIYEIYNISSQLLVEGNLQPFKQGEMNSKIYLPALPCGFYFLKIKNGTETITKSFIINY